MLVDGSSQFGGRSSPRFSKREVSQKLSKWFRFASKSRPRRSIHPPGQRRRRQIDRLATIGGAHGTIVTLSLRQILRSNRLILSTCIDALQPIHRAESTIHTVAKTAAKTAFPKLRKPGFQFRLERRSVNGFGKSSVLARSSATTSRNSPSVLWRLLSSI
jgi:hypothetical protein